MCIRDRDYADSNWKPHSNIVIQDNYINQGASAYALSLIHISVMNGIELIQKLSETYRNIVVVVLSGYGEYEFTSQAMEYGIRHYILCLLYTSRCV